MQATTWVHLGIGAAIALVGGCGGKSSAGAAGPATGAAAIESTTSASPSEQAAAFPSEKFKARCVYTRGDDASEHTRWFRVSAERIDLYDADAPDQVRESLPVKDHQYATRYPANDYDTGVLLLDGMIYLTQRYSDWDMRTWEVCTIDGDLARARRRGLEALNAELNAYVARRGEAAKAAAAAATVAREAEQRERLERLASITSVKLTAGASGPEAPLSLVVTATLEDGSTMRIGQGDPIFAEAFAVTVVRGTTAMMVSVSSRTDDTVRDEQEIAYSFDVDHTFECYGEPGKTGSDFDHAHGMYYHGRNGDPGPDISVEITTTGRTTDDGQQLLRYRVSCGERREVFVTSASAAVHVGTYGGKGGHGVAFPDGKGGNGGNGGDGGDISVTVDPSVRRYKVVPVTQGGKGGAPSDAKGESSVLAYGKRGEDGSPGEVSESRATVDIR